MADGPAGFTQGFTCPALLRIPLRRRSLRIRGSHPLRPRFPARSSRNHTPCHVVLQPRRGLDPRGLGYAPFARHYWGYHVCFLFLRVLRCFSSPGLPPHTVRMTALQAAGLPHSDIRGSQVACTSPRLFAACRVLLRLPEPRHPPYALSRFHRRSCRNGTCSQSDRQRHTFGFLSLL